MSSTDSVSVTTVVAVDPATAFTVFTEEVGAWWRRGARYRFDTDREGTMRFDPSGPEGRLVEVFDDGEVFEVGRVTAWEPGRRLVLGWRGHAFAPGQVTEVEVVFAPSGENATRVDLTHRGWDALPADHPAKHRLKGTALTSLIGLRWADVLGALRAHAAART